MDPTTQNNYLSANVFSPLAEQQRLPLLDMLRGIALAGIILMNIEWFNQPFHGFFFATDVKQGADHVVGWLVKVFVEGKFYKLFALLFGMSFAILLIKAEKTQQPFTAWFIRRMGFLFVLGLLHLWLLWPGDILHTYAFAGILLALLINNKGDKFSKQNRRGTYLKRMAFKLFGLQLVLLTIGGLVYGVFTDHQYRQDALQQRTELATEVGKSLQPFVESLQQQTDTVELPVNPTLDKDDEYYLTEQYEIDALVYTRQQELVAIHNEAIVMASDDYWRMVSYRFSEFGFLFLMLPFSAVFMFLPIFMLGYWLIDSKVLQQPEKHTNLLKYMTGAGLLLGFPLNIAGLLTIYQPESFNNVVLSSVGELIKIIGEMLVTLGYLGMVTLLVQRQRWRRVFSAFVSMGRMSLTNYLLQTLILTSLFYGYAGAMFGEISRLPQLMVAIAVIAFQILFSSLWLRFFQFGPIEWLWRSFSYRKWQPIRQRKSIDFESSSNSSD